MTKQLKHYPKKQISEEDFEKADKILPFIFARSGFFGYEYH